MAKKKHKPKYRWQDAGTYFPYHFTEEDFQSIAEVLEISSLSDELRSRLRDATKFYFIDKKCLPDRPKKSEIIAALSEVQQKAKSLIDCLKNIDKLSLQLLSRTEASPNIRYFYQYKCLSDVEIIHTASKQALANWGKDRGGRSRSYLGLQTYILNLGRIFEEITDKNAAVTWDPCKECFKGRFFEFVRKCIELADKDLRLTNSALGQQIKASLKVN